MPKNALFLNLSCIFCFVKWGGKWKKCQKKCKKSCFFLQHVPQKLKKYRFRHGLHLLLSRQKWKKNTKKNVFFSRFFTLFFCFLPWSQVDANFLDRLYLSWGGVLLAADENFTIYLVKGMPQTLSGHLPHISRRYFVQKFAFFLKNHKLQKLWSNKNEKNKREQVRQNHFSKF